MPEIEARQDEALRMLDDLERRIDLVLAEFAPAAPTPRPAELLEQATNLFASAPLIQMPGLVDGQPQANA
jgi:hypothetical protein